MPRKKPIGVISRILVPCLFAPTGQHYVRHAFGSQYIEWCPQAQDKRASKVAASFSLDHHVCREDWEFHIGMRAAYRKLRDYRRQLRDNTTWIDETVRARFAIVQAYIVQCVSTALTNVATLETFHVTLEYHSDSLYVAFTCGAALAAGLWDLDGWHYNASGVMPQWLRNALRTLSAGLDACALRVYRVLDRYTDSLRLGEGCFVFTKTITSASLREGNI